MHSKYYKFNSPYIVPSKLYIQRKWRKNKLNNIIIWNEARKNSNYVLRVVKLSVKNKVLFEYFKIFTLQIAKCAL